MAYDIDTFIFLTYIIINVGFGLYWGRNVKNIRDYALGGRNFSTGTLVATIMASWIGGDELFVDLQAVYTTGLHFIVACTGQVFELLIFAYLFIPRMGEFLGNLSMPESMGNLYGQRVRVIAAVTGSIVAAGFMAVQFKVFGDIFRQYLGIHNQYTIFIAGSIVVMYSAFGGMRSVAFTDVIQFFTFGVLVPVLSVVIWNEYVSVSGFSFEHTTQSPLFNYREFTGFDNPKLWSLILLFMIFLNPGFHPSLYQKITMGKDIAQVKKAFTISAILLLLILMGVCWIGFLLFNINPNLPPDSLVHYMIGHYAHPGLKGFILVGIVAMCMSNADTNLNAASVILTHDFCGPLGIKLRSELFLSKVISITLGCGAIFLATLEYDLLSLIFLALSFNVPVVSPPMILALFGFRSTEKAVLIGMGSGFVGMLLWAFFMDCNIGKSIIPGMVANIVALMSSHYILKQPGGWVGIKDNRYLIQLRLERKRKWANFAASVKSFNFIAFCKSNAPKNELTYTAFGMFSLISTICTMYSTSTSVTAADKNMLLFFYETMLILSVSFITQPIWPQALRKETPVQIVWNISVFYVLIVCSTFFVMLSNFSQVQIMVFMVNLIVVATLMRWQAALVMIIVGVIATIGFYQHYMGVDVSHGNVMSLEFKGVYLLLLISSMLIMFFKPKQEEHELVEAKNEHLGTRIQGSEEEMQNLINLKNEFLRNLNHEIQTPVTGITSMGQGLLESYDKLTDEQRKEAIAIIAQSSERFNSYTNNILDLSKLTSLNFKLDLSKVNLSDFVQDRLEACKKLYLNKKSLEFMTNIEPGIIVSCDKHYIQLTLDNLIINAINYSKEGKITVSLAKKDKSVEFSIQDEGIGIPMSELYDIFEAFTVSSKTRTPAGGRGVGLALCKKSVEAHGGKIRAESDGMRGARFVFVIPITISIT